MKVQHRYVSPLTDFGFKLLFGTEKHKDLLIHFLNQILPEDFQINHLDYTPNEKLGDAAKKRKAIFDVHGKGGNNERYVLEMQNSSLKFIKDRILYYSAITIREQDKKGKWNYELPPIFTICILNFRFKDKNLREKNRVIHKIYLRDEEGYIFYDKLGYFYVELPNFKKDEGALETDLDKWLFLLRKLPSLKEPPMGFEEALFQKVFEVAEIANLSDKERKKYLESMLHYNTYQLTLKHQRETGREEGIEIGLLQNFHVAEQAQRAAQAAIDKANREKQKALEEKQKLEEEKLKSIRELKTLGVAISKIAEIYGLSIQEVESI